MVQYLNWPPQAHQFWFVLPIEIASSEKVHKNKALIMDDAAWN